MKIPTELLALASLTAASSQPDVNGKSLEQVYGPVAGVDQMEAWSQRRPSHKTPVVLNNRDLRSPEFFATRTPENCVFPLEVFIVADETGSFEDDYDNMLNTQLEAMAKALTATHPESTFGMGSFRDIPIPTLGEPDDYCWHNHQSLTPNVSLVKDAYASLFSSSGGDPCEHAFGGLVAACQGSKVGWTKADASRLIVMVTDAAPHFEGDGFNKPEYSLSPFSGRYDEANAEEQCRTQYYPSPEQVRAVIYQRQAYVGFLIYDGDYSQGGKPIDAWNWFNSYIGQPGPFVENLDQSSTTFWAKLGIIIRQIEEAECVNPDTTAHPETTAYEATTMTVVESTPTTPGVSATTPEGETSAVETNATSTPKEDCPPCMPEDEVDCGCPAVQIHVRDKPKNFHLEAHYE